MIKKKKCNVCNNGFYVLKNKLYSVQENKGITGVISGADVFDAMDCPVCGCQNVIWKRLPKINFNENDNNE